MLLTPALLMVSTIRFRSFKTIDLRAKRSYQVLIALAALVALVHSYPQEVLLVMAYTYLASAFIGQAVSRVRRMMGHAEAEEVNGEK
jgi:CDP-diacylglycerol--serine O-phosphatidyltransferase